MYVLLHFNGGSHDEIYNVIECNVTIDSENDSFLSIRTDNATHRYPQENISAFTCYGD